MANHPKAKHDRRPRGAEEHGQAWRKQAGEAVEKTAETGRVAHRAAAKAVESGAQQAREIAKTARNGAEAGARRAQAGLEEAGAELQDAFQRTTDVNQVALDSLVRSGLAVAKAIEDLGNTWIDLSQSSVEDGAATAKAVLQARNWREVVEAQGQLTRANWDRWLSGGARVAQISAKVVDEAWRPLQTGFNTAADRVFRRAA